MKCNLIYFLSVSYLNSFKSKLYMGNTKFPWAWNEVRVWAMISMTYRFETILNFCSWNPTNIVPVKYTPSYSTGYCQWWWLLDMSVAYSCLYTTLFKKKCTLFLSTISWGHLILSSVLSRDLQLSLLWTFAWNWKNSLELAWCWWMASAICHGLDLYTGHLALRWSWLWPSNDLHKIQGQMPLQGQM